MQEGVDEVLAGNPFKLAIRLFPQFSIWGPTFFVGSPGVFHKKFLSLRGEFRECEMWWCSSGTTASTCSSSSSCSTLAILASLEWASRQYFVAIWVTVSFLFVSANRCLTTLCANSPCEMMSVWYTGNWHWLDIPVVWNMNPQFWRVKLTEHSLQGHETCTSVSWASFSGALVAWQ